MEETITLSQAADLIIVMTFGVTVITVFFGTVTEAVLDLIDTIKKKRKARKEKTAEQSASIEE